MGKKDINRRKFISQSIYMGGAAILPWSNASGFGKSENKKLRIGLIADLHHDIMHDGKERLLSFIHQANETGADFIMQMGDFCVPKDQNKELLDVFKNFNGPSYHILGNHDTDGGFSREDTMKFWGMKRRYYSFDHNGFHFVILDGNDPNPKPWSGYHRYINKEQQEWLRQDLKKTDLNTFIYSHQTIENEEGGVANFLEIRKILEDANESKAGNKVLACFSGHHHTDYMTQINNIYYIQINSASYRWVGDDFQYVRYSEEIDKNYPWIKYTIPYRDPLFTFVEVDPAGYLSLEPKSTEFVGPGPKEMGGPETAINDPIVPGISAFNFKFSNQ
jgi:calcineurin-like phosphoesterase family protein